MASHGAARRAVEAGYTDVSVMVDGLKGWRAAGQPVVKPQDQSQTPRPRRSAPAARRERTRVPGRRLAGQAPPPGPVLRHSRWRSSTRRIFPLTVFGRLSTNSIARGYL